jgi:lactoylglutathione lyase
MKTLALLAAFSFATLLSAQTSASKPSLDFDHTTVYVTDISKSAAFYENVLGLEKLPEPFHDGKHNWYRIGDHSQLHVVAGATKSGQQQDIGQHVAFRVASLADFRKHLDQLQVKYRPYDGSTKFTPRPDGINQIYFQDPDGYWIEVNDDKF